MTSAAPATYAAPQPVTEYIQPALEQAEQRPMTFAVPGTFTAPQPVTYTAPQPAPQPVIADSSQNFIGPLLHENENLAQEGVVVEVAAAVDIHDLPDDEVAAAVGIDDLPDIADLLSLAHCLTRTRNWREDTSGGH